MDGEDDDWSDSSPNNNNNDNGERNPKKPRVDNYTVPGIPTSNVFSPLTIQDDNNTKEIVLTRQKQQQQQQTVTADNKKERIPPITMQNITRADVIQLCSGLKITKYSLKVINNQSISIYLTSVDDFKAVRKYVSELKLPAFTHNLHSELSFRVVLKGLFSMEKKELQDELNAHNIFPEDITIIPMKKRKYDEQAIYLLYFKKGSTNINELRKCQFLSFMRIEWDLYSPRSNGPVRCRRCQGWGHGCKNCWLPVACMFCAENHLTNDCKKVVNGKPVSEDFEPRCANCNDTHSANYDKCESLIEHLKRQSSIAAKNSKIVKSKSQITPPKTTRAHFPASQQPFNFSQMPSRDPNSYANVTRNARSQSNQPTSDLMSETELLSLTRELISSLRRCRNREQQFEVMTSLAIKFVYGNGHP